MSELTVFSSFEIWEDAGLPPPNCMVIDRNTQRAHLYYAIVPVCTSEKARSKPILWMKAIYENLARQLQADPDYHGSVAKTPGHNWWKTAYIHDSVYQLGELAEYMKRSVNGEDEPHSYWAKSPDYEANSDSRHCLLFENLRFFAYGIVFKAREQGSYESFYSDVQAYAYSQNNFIKLGFTQNLTSAQIRATVRSVSRWTWDKYYGTSSKVHRGAMMLGSKLSLKEKQKLSAQRTAEGKMKATASKIRRAYHFLTQQKRELTNKNLAETAGVSITTIKRWADFVEELKGSDTKVISLATAFTKNAGAEAKSSVQTFGVHQIPALAIADLNALPLGSKSDTEGDKGTDDSDTEPPPT